MIVKPTTFQIFVGTLGSIFDSKGENQLVSLPKKVGKYHLTKEVIKENPLKHFGIGIYQSKGETVFIKTWQGQRKNFDYYELVNEYLVNKILHKRLELIPKTDSGKIKTPKVISGIESENSLSIIFEYIDGVSLSSFPVTKQAELVSEVITILRKVTSSLRKNEMDSLLIRDLRFYLLSLPVVAVLSLISNPRSHNVILKAFIDCLLSSRSLKTPNLVLSHRDLYPNNVLVRQNDIFITDCSRMALTVPGYDVTYLSLDPSLKELSSLIFKKLNKKQNSALKNYISIHLASFKYPSGMKNHTLDLLHKMYD